MKWLVIFLVICLIFVASKQTAQITIYECDGACLTVEKDNYHLRLESEEIIWEGNFRLNKDKLICISWPEEETDVCSDLDFSKNGNIIKLSGELYIVGQVSLELELT